MINIKGLNKYYPLGKERFHALKDIDLEVKQGEMLCLTGRSGSGKSTLLHVIGLLDTFESGEYLFDGSTVRELSDRRRAALRNAAIGFIMQDFALVLRQITQGLGEFTAEFARYDMAATATV